MLFPLATRAQHLEERLDDPRADPAKAFNTYRQFALINRFLPRWPLVYRKYIRPVFRGGGTKFRLLDIGFGDGDIALRLLNWARADGVDLEILRSTAVSPRWTLSGRRAGRPA